MAIEKVLAIYGGELARDVAERLEAKRPPNAGRSAPPIELRSASHSPQALLDTADATTLHVFVLQTIENAAPTEEGGGTYRFFRRKTHPADLLSSEGKVFQYAVLGLGDTNLLLDRQTTSARDCNQVAQELDRRLERLGGIRWYPLGLADERADLVEVEPWIRGLWTQLVAQPS